METLRSGLSSAALDESLDSLADRSLCLCLQSHLSAPTCPSTENGSVVVDARCARQWSQFALFVSFVRHGAGLRMFADQYPAQWDLLHRRSWSIHADGHARVRLADLSKSETQPSTSGK